MEKRSLMPSTTASMTFKEFVVESWTTGFPYEVKDVKKKQVIATRTIKNSSELDAAQGWFHQYQQQGCSFEKQLLFSTYA